MSITNRLAGAKSPYLLQHQHNPVDWYPWSDEAFERAAAEDRPIFLSIGYATCHWCHVMERESFEDAEVAKLLNDDFIAIKVDREERPDIDGIYMTVCQMLSGQGGWPLTIVMTPDRKPFFAATYVPKHSRHGRLGLVDLLPRIVGVWHDQRDDVLQSAEHLTTTLQRAADFQADVEAPDETTLSAAFNQLLERYDRTHGGFGSAPKFPTPHNLFFLLRHWRRTQRPEALEMVAQTLARMRRGGIFDQLGGGFHRYSTDAEWLLPHFEKMLYDQALISVACAEAYQATGAEEYEQTARSVLDYVLRDLGAPEGGFYSAEDADSEGREGKFYVWTVEEVEAVLGATDAPLVVRAYGMREEGNFEDEALQERTGENVLFGAVGIDELARQFDLSADETVERLESARRRLLAHRADRVRPALDDKILTDWNGLFIAALAICGRAFDHQPYVDRAREAMDFLLRTMRDDEGGLLHRYRDGEAGIAAMADDYAALVWALIELYETTFDAHYLMQASEFTQEMKQAFWDVERGGFYVAQSDSDDLIVRQKEVYDGAIPSANSLQAWNLVRLARLTGRAEYDEQAHALFKFAAPFVSQQPSAHTALLAALELAVSPSQELVIAGDRTASETRAFLDVVRSGYRPNLVVLQHGHDNGDNGLLAQLAPFVAGQTTVEGKPAAYLCRDFACQMPATDPDELRIMLDNPAAV